MSSTELFRLIEAVDPPAIAPTTVVPPALVPTAEFNLFRARLVSEINGLVDLYGGGVRRGEAELREPLNNFRITKANKISLFYKNFTFFSKMLI